MCMGHTHVLDPIPTCCRTCDVYQTFRGPGDEYTNAYNPQILVSYLVDGW